MTTTERQRMTFAESMRTTGPNGSIVGRDVIAVGDARMVDGDAGGFDAHFATFGTLNSHNEIVLAGAYDDCVDGMVRDGFVCRDHNWNVVEHIAMIVRSWKDKKGQRCELAFHSDPDAQLVRVRMSERIEAGKTVKLSYAFDIDHDGYTVVSGKDAVKHLGPNATKEERARCAKLSAVTIIHRVKRVYEISIVAAPSDAHADVISVRGNATDEASGAIIVRDHDGIALPYLETTATLSALFGILDALCYGAFYRVLYDGEGMTKDDKIAFVRKAYEEAGDMSCRAMEGILADDELVTDARAELRAMFGSDNPDDETIAASRADGRFKRQADALRAGVTDFIDGATDLHITKRERRKLTDARRAMFETLAATLESAAADARGIIEATTPQPTVDAEAARRELELRLLALRD